MSQNITRKFITCASIIFFVLYTIISYVLYGGNNSKFSPIDLLEGSRTIALGTSQYNKDNLKIHTDDVGVSVVLFSAPMFNAKDYAQLQLAVEGLSHNYRIQLMVATLENPEPVALPLLQAQASTHNNLLLLDKSWQGLVTEIGLRILPQEHLGLEIQNTQPIIIKTAMLSNPSYFTSYFTLLNYWLDYKPWDYRSINHLQTSDLLPIYAHPIVFIILWLTLSGVICFFCYGKLNILLLIFMAWMFLELMFLYNTSEKTVWSKNFDSSTEVIYYDENLYELASHVKSLLDLENDKTHKIKNNKVLILSARRHPKLRLIYHMLPVNSAALDTNLKNSKQSPATVGDYILSYDRDNQPLAAVDNVLTVNSIAIKVKEIASGETFVLMQVIQ